MRPLIFVSMIAGMVALMALFFSCKTRSDPRAENVRRERDHEKGDNGFYAIIKEKFMLIDSLNKLYALMIKVVVNLINLKN
jgi:hypothetical protein